MRFFKAVVILCFLLMTGKVFAQSSDELKKKREQINQELIKLNRDYEETSNNKRSTLKQLNLLKEQINLREEKIKNINSSIRQLDSQISDNTNEVHSLQSQLDQLKKEYAAMVLFAFRNQSAYNKLMFLFISKDFNQAYKRLKYLQQIGTYRQRQAEYITGTQKDLNHKIVQLDKNKEEKSNLLVDQEKEKAVLGKEKNNQAKVVVDLSKHEKQLKQQVAEAQRKKRAYDRLINNAIQRELVEAKRKAAAEDKLAANKAKADNKPEPVRRMGKSNSELLSATPEAARLSSDFLGNRGRLPWPVSQAVVTQNYGVYYTDGIKDENKGITVKTSPGAQVRSVFEGEVKLVSDVSGTYLVVINHGSYFTAYSGLRSVSVSKGQKVSTKQMIGIAATDQSTGDAEIGFSVYKGTEDVNPKLWLAPL